MRIERETEPFVPIIIKLETIEEAEDLLHLISVDSCVSLNGYMKTNDRVLHEDSLRIKGLKSAIKEALRSRIAER
ncbi:hypothetical protein GQ472_01810 [archaeon]|nr:hypothetical protein [archaeon]